MDLPRKSKVGIDMMAGGAPGEAEVDVADGLDRSEMAGATVGLGKIRLKISLYPFLVTYSLA